MNNDIRDWSDPDLELDFAAERMLSGPPPEASDRVWMGVMTAVGVVAPLAAGGAAIAASASNAAAGGTVAAVGTAQAAAGTAAAVGGTAAAVGGTAAGAAVITGAVTGGGVVKGLVIASVLCCGGTIALTSADNPTTLAPLEPAAIVRNHPAVAPKRPVSPVPTTLPVPGARMAVPAADPVEPQAPLTESAPSEPGVAAEPNPPAPSKPAPMTPRTTRKTRMSRGGASAKPARSAVRRQRDQALLTERDLLAGARAALARGLPNEALQVIERHTRRFGSGRLVEEREFLRIQALARARRHAEARRAADAFTRRFPRSLLRDGVERAVSSAAP